MIFPNTDVGSPLKQLSHSSVKIADLLLPDLYSCNLQVFLLSIYWFSCFPNLSAFCCQFRFLGSGGLVPWHEL